MSGHTPGPWVADIRSGVVAVFRTGDKRNCLAGARDDAIHYSRAGAEYVEEPHGHWSIPDEVVANARLIAAAPDLLEALEAVEWSGRAQNPATGTYVRCCPSCGAFRALEGERSVHGGGCQLLAALEKATEDDR